MILLLDVDGVLIQNLAYRAALQQTVAYFSRRMGVEEITPTDAEIEIFESQSIIVEWDSGAICIAALLIERLKHVEDPARTLAPDFWEALDQLAAYPGLIERPDFSALARRVGALTPSDAPPAHRALALFLSDNVETRPVASLLSNCYDIDRAPATQVFQNYALGHREYTEAYGLPPHVEGEPLLEKLDRPNLSPEMRDQLLAARSAGEASPILYTARPSRAPLEINPNPRGFTLEAEIARKLAGLDSVPVMGFGKVDWLARRVGLRGMDFVKPSPLQAIAAIAAARTGLELESLKAAFAVLRGDPLRYPLTACAHETVHVFEDSPSSLQGVSRAVEMLNRQGLGLQLIRHGIAPADSPKRATLSQAADVMHADVNEGLAEVLSV
jgi:hypothetical protein